MNLKPETIEEKIEEIWDEFSYRVDDDIDSLQQVASTCVMSESAFKKATVKLIEQVSAIEGYQKTEWVSVRNNPPIAKGCVLVWVGDPVNKPIKHFYTSRGKWICMESIAMPKYYVVDYWMPLPPAPNTKP